MSCEHGYKMHGRYHQEITYRALNNCFSAHAMETIVEANLGQDGIIGQLGHPEYHFDDCKFSEGRDYIRVQRETIFSTLYELKQCKTFETTQEDIDPAWQAFGRLIHAVQDFYAHSNYVALWLARERLRTADKEKKIPVEKIDPLDPDLLYSSGLRSGLTYFPWDYLGVIPQFEPLARYFAPLDSHTLMNLDGPERGPKFAYAYVAAFRRTRYESNLIMKVLPLDLLRIFTDGLLKHNSEALLC